MTTTLPIHLLLRTIPIYSKPFFLQQNAPTKSSVKGWTYIRQGIYWCSRALDKYSKGGKVWRVDIDGWREDGRKGKGWVVPMIMEEEESEESDKEGSEFEGESDGEMEYEDGAEDQGETEAVPAKRKRSVKTTPKKAIKSGTKVTPRKAKRLSHPKTSASHLPSSVLDPADLPTDPYQRALRLLHVGATPESLPCREEEFVDVLAKVEEGVESGGGGCLCELFLLVVRTCTELLSRYRRSSRDRQDRHGPCRRQRAKAESGRWRWSLCPT